MTNIKILEFPDLHSLSIAAVEHFVGLHNPPNKQTFLVPGGQTPSLFYKQLGKKVDDWTGTTLMLSDERLVPQRSAMSNVGMVKKKFILKNIKAVKSPSIMEIVDESKLINPNLILKAVNVAAEALLPLTAAFLGIGEDGHTASLFTGFEKYFFNSESFFKVKKSNELFSRISVSANILIDTPLIFFLVSSSDKKNVMRKILNKSEEKDILPVQKILNKSKGKIVFLCDKETLDF